MRQLAGHQIEEMADVRATRKGKVVLFCSVVAFAIIFSFCLIRFFEQAYLLASVNLLSSVILVLNIVYLTRYPLPKYSGLVLTGVLLFHALILLVYGQSINDRLLWMFPIMATIIFVNNFKSSVFFSSCLFLIIFFSTFMTDWVPYAGATSLSIFLLSLFSLCTMCNIAAYQYAKIANYVQSLYKEGIEDLAYLDQLTGLANRWSFENWALSKLDQKKESDTVTAMVFLDIDNFKLINDSYGHDVGDKVLQHFASRLKNNVRNKDRSTEKYDYSIARFAGDEFVLLLYDVKSRQDLEGILQRICGLFADSYQSTERINQLTISAGVAIYPEDANNLAELTRCADKAMYAAKHAGKNQYRFYRMDNDDIQKKEKTLAENRAKLASVTPLKQG